MPIAEIDRHTYRRVAEFAQTTGTDMRQTVREAVGEWMDTTGDTLIDLFGP